MKEELLDKYVFRILKKNGWYANREFKCAGSWIAKIENAGYSSFEYAEEIIHELGGLSFREYAPMTYTRLEELHEGRQSMTPKSKYTQEIRDKCEESLKILQDLHMLANAEDYNGATFAFNALDAALCEDIVIDIGIAKEIIGASLFPIGTIEPDGIICVTPEKIVYTLFDDSIFWSGCCAEDFINHLFLKTLSPKLIYSK